MRLTSAGQPLGIENAIVGRVSTILLAEHTHRTETVFVSSACTQSPSSLRGYRAIVTQSRADVAQPVYAQTGVPTLHSVRDIDHLRDRDVVVLQPSTGFIRTLYRPDSVHNSIFLTERCNSNCLMCSQPPKDKDDSQHFVETNLELIKFIDPQTTYLGITGGEPTLLRQGLFRILIALRDALPDSLLPTPLSMSRLRGFRGPLQLRHPGLDIFDFDRLGCVTDDDFGGSHASGCRRVRVQHQLHKDRSGGGRALLEPGRRLPEAVLLRRPESSIELRVLHPAEQRPGSDSGSARSVINVALGE
jgi:hypothetical protein